MILPFPERAVAVNSSPSSSSKSTSILEVNSPFSVNSPKLIKSIFSFLESNSEPAVINPLVNIFALFAVPIVNLLSPTFNMLSSIDVFNNKSSVKITLPVTLSL